MNPYVAIGTGIGTPEAASLSARLATWHDAMVAHERALRARRQGVACDDEECPHVEARTLWAEAVATYGARAQELSFLRSRATEDALSAPADRTRPSRRRTQGGPHDRSDRSLTAEPVKSNTSPAETWT